MKSDNESSNSEINIYIFIPITQGVFYLHMMQWCIVKQQAAKLYDPYDKIAYNI